MVFRGAELEYDNVAIRHRVAHTKALVIAFQAACNPFDEDSHAKGGHEVVIIDTEYQIMLSVVSWEEISSMPLLWRIACSLQQSHYDSTEQNPPPRQSTQTPQQK